MIVFPLIPHAVTAGELRTWLAEVPDDQPVMVYDTERDNYFVFSRVSKFDDRLVLELQGDEDHYAL